MVVVLRLNGFPRFLLFSSLETRIQRGDPTAVPVPYGEGFKPSGTTVLPPLWQARCGLQVSRQPGTRLIITLVSQDEP